MNTRRSLFGLLGSAALVSDSREHMDVLALQARYLNEPDGDTASALAEENAMRVALGSPTEQHERLESLIDALDPRHATGIERAASPFWRSSK